MSDEQIDALTQPDTWSDVFEPSELAVLLLADAMAGPASSSLPAELVAELREHFDEVQLAELILVAGQANLNNRAGNAAKQLLGNNQDPAERR